MVSVPAALLVALLLCVLLPLAGGLGWLLVRRSSAPWRAMADASPLGIFRAAGDGTLDYVNDAYLALHGLPREQAARGWLALLPEAERTAAWQEWLQAVQAQQGFVVQRRIRLGDGRVRDVVVRSSPIFVNGALGGHVGTVADITQRLQTERDLRALTDIVDQTSDFVVQTDAQGVILYANRAAQAAAQVSELRGRRYSGFLTPETRERFAHEVLPALREHGIWVGTSTAHGARQRLVPVSHMVIAHPGPAGRAERFTSVMRDISGELDARRADEQQATTLRAIASAIPAMVCVLDAQGRFTFVNAAYGAFHEIGAEQLLGSTLARPPGRLLYGMDRALVDRALAGESLQQSLAIEGGRSPRHVSASLIPLRASHGDVTGVLCIASDITDFKCKEQRLVQLSQRDSLTTLLNRAGLEAYLEQRLALGEAAQLGLLYIDLDGFKGVNDAQGHPVGDLLLQMFAARLKGLVRPSDAVARLGGDEFVVAATGVRREEHLVGIAEKIIDTCATPFQVRDLALQVGASIGIALGAEAPDGWRGLLERADAMLYEAKRAGRGRHAVFAGEDSDGRATGGSLRR